MPDVFCVRCNIHFTISAKNWDHHQSTSNVSCPICGRTYNSKILAEDITNPHGSEVLKVGDVVIVTNAEHVWYNQIALVCDVKHLFYRIELLGNKTWIPQHWVKINEPNDINQ